MTRGRPTPLSIAGSDPTGGAGLEADLKVFLAHGLSGAALATALTVQDTRGVARVAAVALPLFRRRMEFLLSDLRVAGAKTGLLPNRSIVRAAAELIASGPRRFLVVDPVLAPSRGAAFLDRAGRRELLQRLFPLADVVTPNLLEAAALLGQKPATIRRHPERATAALRSAGARAVLLKGGHGAGRLALDLLDDGTSLREFSLPRIRGRAGSVHGTGCALAAALLANVLLGRDLARAVERGKRFVHDAMRGARAIGAGRRQLDFLTAPR
ncbi:MAG: hydroxymethylpyrimidine/phosphomethylpyrimidine kinase [Planctomycetes bacterium]|nr:hydroxymethylpyrimidine/phosphomethylpyrimidine kinase [Planctomycetota bacterium]